MAGGGYHASAGKAAAGKAGRGLAKGPDLASDSDADTEKEYEEDWAAMRSRVKAKVKAGPKPLPARMCDAELFLEMDDKVQFARRLLGSVSASLAMHPPTVCGEDFDTWEAALSAAENAFGNAALWFVKHRRLGGGASVRCVRDRAGAARTVHENKLDLKDHVLQANTSSKLLRGRKCSLRCYGAFYRGFTYYIESEVLARMHASVYSEDTTDPNVHVQCLAGKTGVSIMTGEEYFAALAEEDDVAKSGSQDKDDELVLHDAARDVLRRFDNEARAMPAGQFCIVGLDFLLTDDGKAVCLEANIPCSIFDNAGSKAEELKARMRHELRKLMEGSEPSAFHLVSCEQ
eukprot:TRINITY_DN80676_c0_g1_i1.p1 TRINITY_DN80676_c0_g1~~TRINITY_DN80676_c0_g1_i1.p1  ORF type:complete len:346 (-),score=88.81 TRINITY_DN80676_c0_g1_i1:193-1230(-)